MGYWVFDRDNGLVRKKSKSRSKSSGLSVNLASVNFFENLLFYACFVP